MRVKSSSTASAVAFPSCDIKKLKSRLRTANNAHIKVVSFAAYSKNSIVRNEDSAVEEADAELAPPDYLLDDIALREWRAAAPILAKRGLLEDDVRPLLAGYCMALARSIRAEHVIKQEGRYYKTTTSSGSSMKRRHPAVHEVEEGWAAVRQFAIQLGFPPARKPGKIRNKKNDLFK